MKIQAITGLYARQKAYKNNQSYYTTPLKSDSLTFSSRQRIPVYIIDPKGERKRYDCLADLIQDKKTKFNTRTAFQINFSENSSGVAQNHIIIKADKVEYKDEFGNIKVDEEKFEEVKNLPFTKKRELVLINPDFSYQEFNSLRECAKQLKISDLEAYNLYNIPKNQIPSHIIIDRHEVTNENDNKIDENKVKEIYEKKFRTKLEPIYAISENGACTKFASTRHFSEHCNIPYAAIGVTLNGINNTVRGYLLAKEEDVTSLDENGKKLIDTQKVKELYKKNYKTTPGSLYTISLDGTYQRYETIKDCANALGIASQYVKRVLTGAMKTVKDLAIVRAEEITSDKNNKGEIDLEKFKQAYATAFAEEYRPIYAIDTKGNYQKFVSVKHCSDTLGIQKYTVTKTLEGEYKITKGYTFVPAQSVEKTDEQGNIIVDKEEILKIAKNTQRANKKTIFVINQNGEYKKYDNIDVWAKERGISSPQAYITLKEKRVTRDGLLIVEEDEILSTNEFGVRYIDKNKIQQVIEENFIKTKQNLYAIDRNGVCIPYNNALDCAQKMGIDVAGIYMVLKNTRKTYKNHVFVSASDIEEKGKNGQPEISKQKVQKIISSNFEIKPKICAINKKNIVKMFDAIEQCSQELGVSKSSIHKSLKNKKETKGFIFVYEDEISKQNSDGEFIIDKTLVKNLASTLKTNTPKTEEKPKQKYCLVNFETKKCKITTFNEAVENLLGKKENELDFQKNEILNQKYGLIPLEKITNSKGEIDKTKLKSLVEKFNFKKEKSVNPFSNSATQAPIPIQKNKIEPLSKTDLKGSFRYNNETGEVENITLPDLSEVDNHINYCLVDTETQDFGFFSRTYEIVQALDIISPEFSYCAKMQKLIDNKYAVIYFKDLKDNSRNKNSINEDKFKKELSYFMHISKAPTPILDRSKIKIEPFSGATKISEFDYNEQTGKITKIEIPKYGIGKSRNCLIDLKEKKIGFFDYTGTLARGLKISYQEFDKIREKRKLLDNRYGIIYIDDISSKASFDNKTISEKKLKARISDYIATTIAAQKILDILN